MPYEELHHRPRETSPEEVESSRSENLSMGDIQRYTEELKARVQAAQLQKEKDIEQKLADRETLIAESRKNDVLLNTAEEGLEYFTSVQELGLLTDPNDPQKLEELKTLVDSLKKQQGEIDKNIAAIADQPEIFGKLYDAAERKDREVDVQKEHEQAHTELDPQVDELAHDIQNWAKEKEVRLRLKDIQDTAQRSARANVGKLFDSAKNMLKEGSSLGGVLSDVLRKSSSPEEMKDLLAKERESLSGMFRFKGKEKAAIDFILSRVEEFEAWNKANEGLTSEEQAFQKVTDAEAGMQEQFKTIILKAWEAQNKINELTGNDRAYDTLPRALQEKLESALDKSVKIASGAGGQYQRTEAIKRGNPVYRHIFDIWEHIRLQGSGSALGTSLVDKNPRQTREPE